MSFFGEGPPNASIMIVGDEAGIDDIRSCQAWRTPSIVNALGRACEDAGIIYNGCYRTNLSHTLYAEGGLSTQVIVRKNQLKPHHLPLHSLHITPALQVEIERLSKEIKLVAPTIIVAMGMYATWVLTGALGLAKWRGSHLRLRLPGLPACKVIPTFSISSIFTQWSNRPILIQDLKRVARESTSSEWLNEPAWNFIVKPSFATVIATLKSLLRQAELEELWLDLDLETRNNHIACCGISWSTVDAICIPFMCQNNRNGYWLLWEEAPIVYTLYRLLTHPNVKVRWQNGLYDAQYIYRYWHFLPRGVQDTMISQHTAFVSQPKSLAFQSSMYSPHYVYWKDEGKTWHATQSEEQLWRYNAIDCVRTREVGEVEQDIIRSLHLEKVEAFQQKLFWPVLQAMLKGVRVDQHKRGQLAMEIQNEIALRHKFITDVIGAPINLNSPKQLSHLFYTALRQPAIYTRAKKGVAGHLTVDDEALQKIAEREPILRPIVTAIADIRTLEIFLGTFISASLDHDGRMRCSFNIGGSNTGKSAPYSYRLSSGKNAFGSGANLQTVPSAKSKSIAKAMKRGMTFKLPNIRSIFIPDPGYAFFDMDLDRADLQVVVWEADDADLKAALRMGADLHLFNAFVLEGKEPPPLEELIESHPRYTQHIHGRKMMREFAKAFCHATNYGGSPPTIAAATGRTVHEVERAQNIWFAAHPGIKRWHERTLAQVKAHRFVENKFGYRWHIFDRLDRILPEALAWIPQCLTLDHEVLTPSGWRRLDKVDPQEDIMTWAPDGTLAFDKASWNFGIADSVIDIPEINICCTEQHRIVCYTPEGTLQVWKAGELCGQKRVPRGGYYTGDFTPSTAELIYLTAFQADGHYDEQRDSISFEFTKERKINRLEEALTTLGIPFTKTVVRRDATCFYIPKGKHGLLPEFKVYGPWLLRLSGQAMDAWLKELEFWDGWRSPQGELWFSSSVRENCEWVCTIAALRNLRARWMSDDTRSSRTNYRITIAPNKGKRTQITTSKRIGRVSVACPTVSTGYFLVKRGNEISITGNSTVGCYINRIWMAIYEQVPEVEVLLQVHDSLAGQFPIARFQECKDAIARVSRIVIPYDDPLIIPTGMKTSTISWGDCA